MRTHGELTAKRHHDGQAHNHGGHDAEVMAHGEHDHHDAGAGAHQAHGHGAHGGHGKHAGHHVEMFRRRFWVTLLLSIPVVATSHIVMDWFGYELDVAGLEWVGPVLGSVIFFWGGWPFLDGGRREV